MTRAVLQAARDLLVAREFKAARALLTTIKDDPTAQDWLAKLAAFAPSEPEPSRAPTRENWEFCDLYAYAEMNSRGKPTGKIILVFSAYQPEGVQTARQVRELSPIDDEGNYRDIIGEARNFAKAYLAALGREGWQLVGLLRDGQAEPGVYYLRRPLLE